MSLRFPDFTVPADLATHCQNKITTLVSNDEDRKHLKVLAEERQRYLDILFNLTGEVQLNEYATAIPPLDFTEQKEVA
jgi:hypothetical protein